METLVLDGKTYVKASKAARDLGYATDYVGQLCRSGKVSAHLIGRTWYVDAKELSSHRIEKKRISRVKAREQAHKSIDEHRVKIASTTNTYKNIGIQYEQDAEDLIPQTKKLRVQSESKFQFLDDDSFDEGPVVENKGEKVLMSGDIDVIDVTDGVIDSETTVLTPTTIRKSLMNNTQKKLEVQNSIEQENEIALEYKHERVDFSEKLAAYNVETKSETEIVNEDAEEIPVQELPRGVVDTQSESILPYIFIALTIVIISALSIPLSYFMHYSNDGVPVVESTYNFSISKAESLIRLKI